VAKDPKDQKGRPYHVRLSREQVGRIALLPGDPGRVPLIAKRLDRSKPLSANREFTAYSGYAGREKVVVMSTGIGGPSTAIAVEELARLGVETMIRVGTCGAITADCRVGSTIIADSAVRMEGTSSQYVMPGYPAAATPEVVIALSEAARGSGIKAKVGVVASTDSFYVGQGRASFGGYFPSFAERTIDDLRQARVLCFEMEASTLFTVGRLLGARTGAVLAVVANRVDDEFKSGAGVEDSIKVAISAVGKIATDAR